MFSYHASFSIRGEVVAILRRHEPDEHLLVDITAPGPVEEMALRGFVPRTSFSIRDAVQMEHFENQVSPGDIIEAEGAFWQTNYFLHGNSLVDTSFVISSFSVLERHPRSVVRIVPFLDVPPAGRVH
ncbi:hypothetical protein [Maritimibacter sp. 55A14]|uniref:hypothetical protein n=1 Tax=Maritimibacter sp. 55A14 TaxID=2174844 RepID=UPI0011B274B8|nr:hypothetical protein [Maritimibacter sp. 55A14]